MHHLPSVIIKPMFDDIKLATGHYVVAVSGGVDSVVLLDILTHQPGLQLIVAHFDHGIRADSAEDARFVKSLANKYNLLFETRREELGPNANEDLARDRRYDFLRSIAKKYEARIVTAHHSDDVIESIAINIYRGTGWRGLAVMSSDIIRPLCRFTKKDILGYAQSNQLLWREDHTNNSDLYLRNRIRKKLVDIDDDTKNQLLSLWMSQKELKNQIDAEVNKFLTHSGQLSRYFFICIDSFSAIEILKTVTNSKLTRPQLYNLLLAIKTMPSGKMANIGSFVEALFTTRNFSIKLLK